ncbi:MAG: hypothetical protein JNK55_20305 [Rubrivivax sp.]|nr:hypothetical protein [Rubrivivax sp.]
MQELRLASVLNLKAPAPGALPSRLEGVAYSGAIVPSYGVVIDVASTKATAPMVLLAEHDRSQIVGVVEQIAFAGGRITVQGRIFSDMPGSQAERIAQLAQRGTPWQLSVGLHAFTEEVLHLEQSATVNDQTVRGPLTVLRNGIVRECSIVTLGADRNTSARLFGGGGRHLSAKAIYERRQREAAACRR